MAANFKISAQRKNDKLHLKLTGDFDGTSACELLDIIRKKSAGVRSVFIHTDGLKDIYPFGQDTFKNNLYTLKEKLILFQFTGRNASELVPEYSRLCRIV